MHIAPEVAVANGADWLDRHYPGWVDAIDLGALNLGHCSLCVLGQVWTGCVPDGEREHILSQVADKLGSRREAFNNAYWLRCGIAEDQGYQILAVHDFGLTDDGDRDILVHHGFVTSPCTVGCPDDCTDDDYGKLTDTWTRLVIQRRRDVHVDVVTESSALARLDWDLVPA